MAWGWDSFNNIRESPGFTILFSQFFFQIFGIFENFRDFLKISGIFEIYRFFRDRDRDPRFGHKNIDDGREFRLFLFTTRFLFS